jgi:hypothetical protein
MEEEVTHQCLITSFAAGFLVCAFLVLIFALGWYCKKWSVY